MLRKAAIDRFVCPCSRPVLPEVDSLALAVDPSYRKSIRLRAMREGRKCRRFDSIRLESLELINSFALVVDEDDSTHRKSGRE